MSRKSRYENVNVDKTQVWKAGVYIRLSKEDEDKRGINSQSVLSQRQLIDKYLREHPEIDVVEYFIDDGFSGTTMERPEFQRMKEAFESGMINCIVVKDLSRFARNDDECGRYLYVIFPFYKIRFISVNDRVDSFENPKSINNLEIPFKNIMHSEYSRDLSKKVISASDTRRRRGEFIGAFCAYGYKKDPNNFHHLIVDEPAATVIRSIFRRYIETGNAYRIAKELNENNVLTPLEYKRAAGINLQVPRKRLKIPVWNESVIRKILEDEVYLGHLIQGKRRKISYKVSKIVAADESEWIKVENTHEAIVSQEDFDRVRQILQDNSFKRPNSAYNNIFAAKLFCGDCGAAMAVGGVKGKPIRYAYCRIAYRKIGACSPKRIRLDALENVVLSLLNTYVNIGCELSKLVREVDKVHQAKVQRQEQQTVNLKCQLERCRRAKMELYSSYKEGTLTAESFQFERDKLSRLIDDLESKINQSDGMTDTLMTKQQYSIFWEFVKHRKFSKLTSDIMNRFIQKILVYDLKRIEIFFTFAEEFIQIKEYVETHNVTVDLKELKII